MKLENLADGDSQSTQTTYDSGTKKSRRGFLASAAAATAAVAGLGAVGTAAANDNARYITLTNFFDEQANYYLEVSGSLEKSERYNATVDNHDEFLNGGSAVSGHVWNGRDTYRYTGDVESLGSNQPLKVEVDGKVADPYFFLRDLITIAGPHEGMASYELSVDGFFTQSRAGSATIDPNDNISAYTAYGQVGYSGRDSYATNAQVENIDVEEGALVYINNNLIDPDRLPELTGP